MILLNLPYTLERSFMIFIVSEHQWYIYIYIYIYIFFFFFSPQKNSDMTAAAKL